MLILVKKDLKCQNDGQTPKLVCSLCKSRNVFEHSTRQPVNDAFHAMVPRIVSTLLLLQHHLLPKPDCCLQRFALNNVKGILI